MMGSRRRPLGRSYSGNGCSLAYSPGPGSDGEDNGPLVEFRPERRSYLLSVRPENSLRPGRVPLSSFGRSTFCAIIAQLTEETQPIFETTLKSYAVSKGADAKFTCIVLGYPQPEVTWYKDDEEMDRYCGLPKYEIFHHGNRHTLQLYKCQEEDAAIYQASARNHKGIVSCSGVLEVGTMTEYKIHQRWFARLKRNAEAKLCEIEQSRKRGKEKVEVDQLRRVSPDRFQRKRRLTGDVGMRSGTSLWDQEEVAKVRIPDGNPCFGEDKTAKSPEVPRNATTLFTDDFIAGHLEGEVATPNGDTSLESREENGERSDNGFLQYIYETVEIVTKELSAKKKKKEEETNWDGSQQEDGMQRRRNISVQKNVVSSRTINGDQVDSRPQEIPMSPLRSVPSKAGTHFSLKEMYSDIGAKPEGGPKMPEGKARPMEKVLPTGSPSGGEEPPAAPLKRAKPEGMREEMKVEQKAEGVQMKHCKKAFAGTIEDLTAQQFQHPSRAAEPVKEVQGEPKVEQANGSTLDMDFLQLNQTVERNEDTLPIRETDLLDNFPSVSEPVLLAQETKPSPSLQPLQDAKPASQPESRQEQLPGPRPSEASKNFSAACDLQSPDSRLWEETNQERASVSFRKSDPGDLEVKRAEEQSAPNPDIQDSSMGKICQKVNSASIFQNPPSTSQKLPPVSSGATELNRTDHLLPKDEVERDSPGLGQDESQQGRPPDHVSNELMCPELPAQEVSFKARSLDDLDRTVSQISGVRKEKPEETAELLRNNKPNSKIHVLPEGKRPPSVTERPRLLPEVVVGTPDSSKMDSAVLPPALHNSSKPDLPSSVKDDLARRNQGDVHWLKDVEREREIVQTSELVASETVQQISSPAFKEIHIREKVLVSPESKGEQQGLTPGKKRDVGDRKKEKMTSHIPSVQNFPQPESVMEENPTWEKEQHKNLVSSLKNYLLLLLKMSTEPDRSKGSPKKEVKATEEKTPPTALPKHLPDVGIAGLTPRTSRKIFERVETDQLFQSAESLQLTPKTSRRLTGMINRELMACQESQALGLEAPSLPCVPSIVVGSVVGELARLPGPPSLESSSEDPTALPSATPQELASGARRKIFLPKAKQADEAEENQARAKRDSPTVSPQQSHRGQSILQPRAPASPSLEKCSPNLPRKMATLEVPKMYEELAGESEDTADGSLVPPEGVEKSTAETETVEPSKANDRFKAPQVIRKIRAEQFSDASGNMKLWCQFFNILTDSRLTWYKDKLPVAEVKRSSGDEGQAALAIVQMSMKDCGVYQCTIQNEYGTDTTNFLMSPEVMSGFLSKEDMEAGEEIEMTPMVFAKGLADSGFWGDKLFGRIMVEDLEAGQGFLRKACRARAIYGLEPVFESGHTGIIKIHNLIAFGGRSENTLVERNYDITIQECKIQNSTREYGKIFAAETRALPAFGPVPEIIPLYLVYRPANNIPYATMEEDLPGLFERYCGRNRDACTLVAANPSEIGQKCCAFQHWLYQWTNGNMLVTDLEGVGWKITNVRIATKTKGYQGLKESCSTNLLDNFVATHQCNPYCELLALKSLDVPQPPPRSKGSRSPNTGRKAPSAQSSPQLQKKGLSSPQASRKGPVSPKSARKGPENGAESRSVARPKGVDLSKAGQLQ